MLFFCFDKPTSTFLIRIDKRPQNRAVLRIRRGSPNCVVLTKAMYCVNKKASMLSLQHTGRYTSNYLFTPLSL